VCYFGAGHAKSGAWASMPYHRRHYLDDPPDNAVVWRYMNLEKLLSILIDRALFFASASTLRKDDQHEGQPTQSEIDALGVDLDTARELERRLHKPTEQLLFFNCWHMNDSESDAMWKVYVNGIGGVAIRSTVARLKGCFEDSPKDISIGRISYDNNDNHYEHALRRFMRKKPAFKHEQEVRLVLYDAFLKHRGKHGLLIPIDVNVLIEKIVVSPRAEDWFISIVKSVVTRFEYDIEVILSNGSTPPPL
jgi:hypothetical protein